MRDDCHVCGAKLERGSPHRATCAPLPVPLIRVCMYVQTMNHIPLLHPPSPPNAIPCIPLQPLPLSVRLREPSNFAKTATTVVTVAVVALFPPPSFFSPPCSYTRQRRQEREQQWEYHVSARDPILTFGHPPFPSVSPWLKEEVELYL